MNDWRVVTYCTNEYEKYADSFVESCEKYDLDCSINFMRDILGTSWHENVAHKMMCILMELIEEGTDVVWCDIDAKFNAYPTLFDTIDADFAAYPYPITHKNKLQVAKLYGIIPEYLYFTGTMFFKNNERSRELLRRWIKNHTIFKTCECPTQASLYHTLNEDRPEGLTIYDLPESYCYIMPKKGEPDPDRVIEHYIVSAREGLKCQTTS